MIELILLKDRRPFKFCYACSIMEKQLIGLRYQYSIDDINKPEYKTFLKVLKSYPILLKQQNGELKLVNKKGGCPGSKMELQKMILEA